MKVILKKFTEKIPSINTPYKYFKWTYYTFWDDMDFKGNSRKYLSACAKDPTFPDPLETLKEVLGNPFRYVKNPNEQLRDLAILIIKKSPENILFEYYLYEGSYIRDELKIKIK